MRKKNRGSTQNPARNGRSKKPKKKKKKIVVVKSTIK